MAGPENSLRLMTVPKSDPIWHKIANLFDSASLSGNLKVEELKLRSILAIQNILHWQRFRNEFKHLKEKLGADPRILELWHGTSRNDPREIISSESGLNVNFARGGQQWGKGLHFAADVSYSCPTFCYKVPDRPGTYQVLLCDVLVGACMVVSAFDKSHHVLLEPPLVPGSTNRFDCVQSVAQGSIIYVVYQNQKVCPRYLIEFSV